LANERTATVVVWELRELTERMEGELYAISWLAIPRARFFKRRFSRALPLLHSQ